MAETPQGAPPPSREEALGWVGCELDDVDGKRVGRVSGLYADAEGSAPAWLVVAVERRRRWRRRTAKAIAVPVRECAAMPGRVWVAEDGATLRDAPAVDPARPLLREHETAICRHYGIGEGVGRHAEVAGRPQGAVTAHPA